MGGNFDFSKIDFNNIENKEYLIEASAGTGKTHCLGQIFIKSVLDGIEPEKILLVTFTNAAAEEIKDRILVFLFESKRYLEYQDLSYCNKIKNDKLLINYLDKIRLSCDYKNKIKRLESSISCFDKILSCTIHSFAIRLCKEFESELGLGFEYGFKKNFEKLNSTIFQKFFSDFINDSTIFNQSPFLVIKKDLNKLIDFIEKNRFLKDEVNESIKYNKKYLLPFFKFYIENSLELKKILKDFSFNDSIDLLIELIKNNIDIKRKIVDRFKVLIVDEFQDTDKKQVELFNLIFKGKTIFYIGDPKQSIYSFRGGDLYNYLDISEKIKEDSKFNLYLSYRSTSAIANFINDFSNKLFSYENDNLVKRLNYKDIKSARPDENINSNAFLYDFSKYREDKNNDFLLQKIVAYFIIEKVNELKNENPNLNLNDIAILLKSNDEIDKFYRIFNNFNFPIALKIYRPVFDTDEAIFIYYLLNSIVNRTKIYAIKQLISTSYFTLTLEQINENIDKIYSILQPGLSFLENQWKNYGIFSIFENLFLNSGFKLEYFNPFLKENYERKLTNIRQIFEILAFQLIDRKQSLYNQLEIYYNILINKFSDDIEDLSSMRIESEEDAVIISTIHSAKGLEYDTVFCPNIFKKATNRYPEVFYIKENEKIIKSYVLASEFENIDNKKASKIKECINAYKTQQNINLAYVAITRAKNNLFVFIQKSKNNKEDFLAVKLIDEFKNYGLVSTPPENLDLEIKENKNVELKLEENEKIIEARKLDLNNFNIKIENIYSYSSIASLKKEIINKDEKEKKAIEYITEYNPYKEQIFYDFEEKYSTFKGRLAGNIFHETMDEIFKNNKDFLEKFKSIFADSRENLFSDTFLEEELFKIKKISENIIKKFYKSKDIIELFVDENARLILNTLKTVVPFLNKRIFEINDALTEVEFLAKAKEIRLKDFYNICEEEINDKLKINQDLNSKDLLIKGYFKGFIDFMFIEGNKIHFLDWKTTDLFEEENYIDYSTDFYIKKNIDAKLIQKNLEKVIKKNYYDIQYILYSAAIYKFIKSYKLPLEFGNVYYFFVRYIDEYSNIGVFTKKFDEKQLEKISEALFGG